MDELEKLIRKHKDELLNDSLHAGHFERFEMKMPPTQRTSLFTGSRQNDA